MNTSKPQRLFFTLAAASIVIIMAHPSSALAAPASGVMQDVTVRFQNAVSGWGEAFSTAGQRLFWMLAPIGLVWRAGTQATKGGGATEVLAEFVRFTIFIGFFFWLCVNGLSMAKAIVSSMEQLAGLATGNDSLNPSGIMDLGFSTLSAILKTFDSLSWDQVPEGIILLLAGFVFLGIVAIISINMLLAIVSSWILMYAGIFILGFGGSSWTSEMAIGYFRAILSSALRISGMILVVSVGRSVLTEFTSHVEALSLGDVATIIVAAIVIYLLSEKIPEQMASLSSGSTGGNAAITGAGAAGAGLAAAAMMTTAIKMAAGAVSGGATMAAGAAEAVKAAVSEAQNDLAQGAASAAGGAAEEAGEAAGGLSEAMGGSESTPASDDDFNGNSVSGGSEDSDSNGGTEGDDSSEGDSTEGSNASETATGEVEATQSGAATITPGAEGSTSATNATNTASAGSTVSSGGKSASAGAEGSTSATNAASAGDAASSGGMTGSAGAEGSTSATNAASAGDAASSEGMTGSAGAEGSTSATNAASAGGGSAPVSSPTEEPSPRPSKMAVAKKLSDATKAMAKKKWDARVSETLGGRMAQHIRSQSQKELSPEDQAEIDRLSRGS